MGKKKKKKSTVRVKKPGLIHYITDLEEDVSRKLSKTDVQNSSVPNSSDRRVRWPVRR